MHTFVQMNICTCLHLANVCDNLQLSEFMFFEEFYHFSCVLAAEAYDYAMVAIKASVFKQDYSKKYKALTV